MCLKQTTLLIVTILSVTYKNSVNCCLFTFSSLGEEIRINYFAYENDNETEGCITPSSTGMDNPTNGNLLKITMRNQNVPTLQKDAVVDFSYLTTITMQNNKIGKINTGAFSNLPQLEIFDLSTNKIKLLEDSIFFNVQHLQTLNLSRNQLTNFKQSWLGDVYRLECLNLSYNSIENLLDGTFTNLPKLRTLDLSHNRILHIDDKAFKGVSLLNYLDCSYNRLNHLGNQVFKKTPGLTVFNLYNNNITYVSSEFLDSFFLLRELVIRFNPLQCGCYNKILTWASNINVDLTNKKLICNKTENVHNIPVCVTPQNIVTDKETECVAEVKENLYNILHSEQSDFECYWKHD